MNLPKLAALCVLNAFIMMAGAWYLLNSNKVRGDEAALIKWSSIIKKAYIEKDKPPPEEEFYFVDVANSKALIPLADPEMTEYPGYSVVTDRVSLGKFFELCKKYPVYDFIICDILMDWPSPQDSVIRPHIEALPKDKFLTVSNLEQIPDSNAYKALEPVFDVPYALGAYNGDKGAFLKYKILEAGDSIETYPFRMYEMLHGDKKFEKRGPFYYMDGKMSLNSMIIDFDVRPHHLGVTGEGEKKRGYAMLGLHEFLDGFSLMQMVDPEFDERAYFEEYFKGKIIVLGNFTIADGNDVHTTVFGDTPGTLIMINTYLSLVSGLNFIAVDWVISHFLFFVFLSYFIFAVPAVRTAWMNKIAEKQSLAKTLKFLRNPGALLIWTLISYFLFNIHINIGFLFVYVLILTIIKNAIRKRQEKKAAASS